MLAPIKCSIRAESSSQRIQKISASISPCAQISREMHFNASRCKENSIKSPVLAPALPACQTLCSLDVVEKSHQGHFSLSVSSEGVWSLGSANKGFSFDQALRKDTLWSQSQRDSPPHWLFMKAIFRITDGKYITRSYCYSHKDRSGWSRHITCKTQHAELCLASWQSKCFVLPHYLSNPIHSGKLDHVF